MVRPKIRFGVCLPQHGAEWAEVLATAKLCERLGYDSLWAVDHVFSIPEPSESIFEGWTEIAALAAATERITLGHLVLCLGYRHPSLLAKMAATLDHISGGRFILGLGCGWHEQEALAYGLPFPPVRKRLKQLDEGLQLIQAMWKDSPASFFGEQFHIEEAWCEPKPLGQIPILIGGGGEKVLLRLVAEHAQIWNNLGLAQAELPHKVEVLKRHCDKIDRDFSEIEISQQTTAAIGATEAEGRRAREAILAELPFLGGGEDWVIAGTPAQCIERIEKTVAAGATTLILSFGRKPPHESLELFAEQVLPAFR
ncbi:MAG: TIGR03560 family F420-dependent LLM class oxidoreductase [Deltaproteobacteria bacterium]